MIRLLTRRATGIATALALLLLGTTTAEAHSDLRLGPFAVGILHPLQTPAHLLVLIALGLILARRPPFRLAPLLGLFAPAAAVGLLLTLADNAAPAPAQVVTGLALALGALLAAGRMTSPRVDAALLTISALLLGLDSGFANPSALVVAKVLFGNWVCLLVVVGYLAFYASLLPPRSWVRTAFRVAGSWVVAISFFLLVAR